MPQTFLRLDVSGWRFARVETKGQGENTWLHRPDGPVGPEAEWLFKPVRFRQGGVRVGGDWSEKAAAELATAMGVPCAKVELARWEGRDGCVSQQVRDIEWDLNPARIWMDASTEVDYVGSDARKSRRGKATAGYTLANVRHALAGVGPPPGFPELEPLTGWEVFSGVLLFDALVANQDRHEENWAVLRSAFGPMQARLAPAFDQEGGLGYRLSDDDRTELLEGRRGGLAAWLRRGKAVRFADRDGNSPLTLLSAAGLALSQVSSSARRLWLDSVSRLTPNLVSDVFTRLESMSDAERMFAIAVVNGNIERIQRELNDSLA